MIELHAKLDHLPEFQRKKRTCSKAVATISFQQPRKFVMYICTHKYEGFPYWTATVNKLLEGSVIWCRLLRHTTKKLWKIFSEVVPRNAQVQTSSFRIGIINSIFAELRYFSSKTGCFSSFHASLNLVSMWASPPAGYLPKVGYQSQPTPNKPRSRERLRNGFLQSQSAPEWTWETPLLGGKLPKMPMKD